jgi:hypothetical protein
MKYEEYIKKLDSLDEELEEGMLSDLQQKPPLNLHENIMNSISKERKRIPFLNYKMYMPVVAAVLVIAVVINKPEIIKKLGLLGNYRPVQKQTAVGSPNTESGNNAASGEAGTTGANVSANNDGKNAVDTTPLVQNPTITASDTPVAKDNKPASAKDSEVKTDSTKNTNVSVAAADKKSSNENINTASEGEDTPFDLAGILGFVFLKEPEVNYEIVLNNDDSDIVNYIKNSENGKIIDDSLYKFTVDKFKPLDEMLTKGQVRKTTVNNLDELSKEVVLRVLFVNYDITISDSQPDIMKFINDNTRCEVLGDNTYKISNSNFKELDTMLVKGNIEKKVLSDINGDFVVIKVLIVNYEITVDGNTEILNFIKEKCFNVQDNIYVIGRNDFKEFEGILQMEAIDKKIINESQDSSIVLRILNN